MLSDSSCGRSHPHQRSRRSLSDDSIWQPSTYVVACSDSGFSDGMTEGDRDDTVVGVRDHLVGGYRLSQRVQWMDCALLTS